MSDNDPGFIGDKNSIANIIFSIVLVFVVLAVVGLVLGLGNDHYCAAQGVAGCKP